MHAALAGLYLPPEYDCNLSPEELLDLLLFCLGDFDLTRLPRVGTAPFRHSRENSHPHNLPHPGGASLLAKLGGGDRSSLGLERHRSPLLLPTVLHFSNTNMAPVIEPYLVSRLLHSCLGPFIQFYDCFRRKRFTFSSLGHGQCPLLMSSSCNML